jgi:hypothetical protein
MSRSIRTLAAVVVPLAGASALAAGPPAHAEPAAALPRLLSCGGVKLLRPTGVVVLSCADANTEIKGTRWLSWGPAEATGTTDFGINLCTPTCAASRIRFFPASTIRLLGARSTRSGRLFSRAEITYTLNGVRRSYTAYPAT